MAGEERDKTQLLLERVKVLEERFKTLLQLSIGLLAVMTAVARLYTSLLAQTFVLLAGATIAVYALAAAYIHFSEAETTWGKLLRDPLSPKWILGLIAIVACFGITAVVLALLGLWR